MNYLRCKLSKERAERLYTELIITFKYTLRLFSDIKSKIDTTFNASLIDVLKEQITFFNYYERF